MLRLDKTLGSRVWRLESRADTHNKQQRKILDAWPLSFQRAEGPYYLFLLRFFLYTCCYCSYFDPKYLRSDHSLYKSIYNE